jgi:PAS domain S-box-containing protein
VDDYKSVKTNHTKTNADDSVRLFSEQTGQAILDAVDDGILLLNQHGFIRTSNRVADRIFGFKGKELLEQSLKNQLEPESHKIYRDEINVLQQDENLLNPNKPNQRLKLNLTGIRSDRSYFPLQVSIHSALVEEEAGFVVTLSDLSEKIEQASQIEKTLKIKSAISDASLDALITINKHDTVVEWSNAAQSIFGWMREEVMGKTMNEIIVPETLREAHKKGMKVFIETGEGPLINKRVEIEALHREGHLFPVELGLVAIEHDGERLATAFVRDISERKLAEKELLEAKEKAESASKSKSRFLSYMSHEIRSPLNAVLGSLGLLNSRLETPEQIRLFQIARSSGANLLTVINEILDFSKIEAGHLEVSKSPVLLIDSLHRLLSVADSKCTNERVEMYCYIDQQVPNTVEIDEAKLRQILTILLDNAIKFTEHGCVETWVTVDGISDKTAFLNIEVVDSGVGIEANMLPSVFAEFEQVDAVRDTGYGGTGLGLAIAKRFVDAMKGKISVTSKYGEGCRFQVRIPIPTNQHPIEQNTISTQSSEKIFLFTENLFLTQFMRRVIRRQFAGLSYELIVITKEIEIAKYRPETESGFIIVDSKWPATTMVNNYALSKNSRVAIVASALDCGIEMEQSNCQIFERPLVDRDISNWLKGKKPMVTMSRKICSNAPVGNNELILLVEDVEANRVIAREMLRESGFVIHEAVNGLRAVELAEETKYDVILMDMRMPVLTGLDATLKIRKESPLNSETPIIALTANAEISEIERCLAVGINEFISKPYDFDNLILVINQLVKNSRDSQKRTEFRPSIAAKNALGSSNKEMEVDDEVSNNPSEVLSLTVIEQLARDTSLETLPQMLQIFCDEIKNRVRELTNANASQDINEIIEQSHAIKSCSGTFGATQLYLSAQCLEGEARQASTTLDALKPLIESTNAIAAITVNEYLDFDTDLIEK